MNTELKVNIDLALCKRFEMALQLNGDDKEVIISDLLKSIIFNTL